jgi:hypothetical protein
MSMQATENYHKVEMAQTELYWLFDPFIMAFMF